MLQQNVGSRSHSELVPVTLPKEEWSQQTEEPLLWYQRFYSFLLLPPRSRSMLGAYKAYVKRTDPDRAKQIGFSKTPQSWVDAASKYDWERRAIAYDIAQHEKYIKSVEEQRQAVEEELRTDALIGWRKAMEVVEVKPAESMSLQAAIYAMPRLYGMIRELFGFDQQQALTLETIMAALPAQLRSQVLANIRIGQVNITVNQSEQGSSQLLSEGEVVEGEVIEG